MITSSLVHKLTMYKNETKKGGCSQGNRAPEKRPTGEVFRMRPFQDQEPRIETYTEHRLKTRKTGEPFPKPAVIIREILDAGLAALGHPLQEEMALDQSAS